MEPEPNLFPSGLPVVAAEVLEVKELAAHCFVDGTAYSARVPDSIQRQNYLENWLEQAALTHP